MTSMAKPARKKVQGRSLEHNQHVFVWCCIIPVFLIFLCISFIPIINSIYGSLFDWNAMSGRMDYIGLANYQKIPKDFLVTKAFGNTFYFAILAVGIKTVIALVLALAVHSVAKGQGFFRTVFFLPSICSVLATSFVFRFLFQADLGTINGYLTAIGIPKIGWLQDAKTAMFTVVLYTIWKDMGFVFLIFLAGIQGISPEVVEAASIDGANGFKRIWYIILPLLRPITAYNVATQIIGSLQAYTSIVGLTQSPMGDPGGPAYSTTTLCVYIYRVAFKDYKFGYGSAIAVVMFAMIMILTLAQLWLQRRKEAN